MRKITSFLVLISLPVAAPAAKWEFAANCGSGDQVRAYSYDSKSIRRNGPGATVAVKGDYSRIAGSRAREARLLWSFDCPSRTFVERARIEYGAGNAVVASYSQPTMAQSVGANSVAAKVYSAVCA